MAPKKAGPGGKKATEERVEISGTAKAIVGGLAFLLLAVLWFATMESASDALTREIITNFDLKQVAVQLSKDSASRHILTAKQTIYQGQPILSIAGDAILDIRTIGDTPIGRLLRADNGTAVNEIGRDNQLPNGAFTLMSFAAYFAVEKRLGSASKFAPFFAALSQTTESAVFWDPSILACLDPSVTSEYRAQVRIVNATKEVLAIVCDSDSQDAAEVGCKSKPFSEDELGWGLAVYLQHNFQDQAFIPLLSFARYDNTKPGVAPQFDRETGLLHFIAGSNLKKGDEVNLNFLRGPHVFLASFGSFSTEDARGVELALQIPMDDETTQKICPITELQFGTTGKPREGLVNCMSFLVAPPELRAKVAKNPRKYRTPELTAYTYGNLTVAANMMLDDKIDDAACSALPDSRLVSNVRAFNSWRRKVLKSNQQYLEQTAAQKYNAAGLPLPSANTPEPAPLEEEAI